MKLHLKISVGIAIISGLFLSGKVAAAATPPTILTVHLQETDAKITQDLINEWRGSFTLVDKPGFIGGGKRRQISYDPTKVYAWVESFTASVNQNPQDGSIKIKDNHATHFTPPVIGKRLDPAATTRAIIDALTKHKREVDAVVFSTSPDTDLASTNHLGINELIGHGESVFKGSPKNRRHNIATGVEKLKGTIVAPGAEFSFNENICPVDKNGGYLPELVIKAEGTIPEYGGGLCQVSSTVFRAAMDAGLSIVQRKNHSYAVQYYAPQGSDATTYCGGVDFKFKNDTPAHILIWPYFEKTDKLIFDFYGTKDDREVKLDKPTQYDRKPDGSMKATWTRYVTKNGVTITDVFKSNYLSPALFHKEEKLDTPGQANPSINSEPTATPSISDSPPPQTPTPPPNNTNQ